MEAFLVSTVAVAIGELGDKTQLLALVLAARYRRPLAVILGIAVATIANHACAGLVGTLLRGALTGGVLRWLVGATFLAIAAWALVPDRMDETARAADRRGAFLVTLIAFFFAEMGDKTQIATVTLAARYDSLVMVVAGTTLGMLCADVPAVLVGNAARALPLRAVRLASAALFAALGAAALLFF
jgi:putative Ca2+/H+ antiporter (TMEM165/GDT1 family)